MEIKVKVLPSLCPRPPSPLFEVGAVYPGGPIALPSNFEEGGAGKGDFKPRPHPASARTILIQLGGGVDPLPYGVESDRSL